MQDWKILTKKTIELNDVGAIKKVLLANRGYVTKKDQEAFLAPINPEIVTWSDLGINKTEVVKLITRVRQAKKAGEGVIIYGDYDTDGICAAAILWECLHALGLKALPHIPNRFEEGYGINKESITKLQEADANLKLIITVDNGIVANDAILFAKDMGIDVIITDHHQKDLLPEANAIIHTTQIGGAGVAWFVAKEIATTMALKEANKLLKDWLTLAAIGTISDVLPLQSINRSIVAHGLKAVRDTQRVGLLKLLEVANIDKQQIGTYEIGFVIAPRINAMGRLSSGIDALRLLCTNDEGRAQSLARLLNTTNIKRRAIVDNVSLHAQKSTDLGKRSAIVLAHESYHEGVIGLAASELVKKFYRPAIVITKGKEVSKASARSIEGFDIMAAIRKLKSLIINGGGHTMAAGFTIKTKNIETFTKNFEAIAASAITEGMLKRLLKIDAEISLGAVDDNLLSMLKDFAPFGPGNHEPTFATNEVVVANIKPVGSDAKHLKLQVSKEKQSFEAIAFGMGKLSIRLKEAERVSLAYNVYENNWNGNHNIELKIRDIKYNKR